MEFSNQTKNSFHSKFLSWESSFLFLFRIQKRLSKSFIVGDFSKCLFFQKLILQSNRSRLLAIREVTQLSSLKKVSGVDGKTFLTFTERFELNELLRLKFNNWYPAPIKNVSILKKDGNIQTLELFTISDRVWQLLVKYSIEPVYEVFLHPHIFGFRVSSNFIDLQKFLFNNFSLQSNVLNKRVLLFDLQGVFNQFNKDFILEKLIAPRGIKLGLFRSFNVGFRLGFPDYVADKFTLSSLLANIVLNDISFINCSVRFGYDLLYILKPFDDERVIFNKLVYYLRLNKLDYNVNCLGIFSPLIGFDFLDWNYTFSLKRKDLIVIPNFQNYQKFLYRVKRILNNSNYGSIIKATKLSVLVKEWRLYNKFCYLNTSRLSLFYLKKRAFKVFNKESKQDFYSSRKLLDKAFSKILNFDKHYLELEKEKSPYFGHLVFSYDLGRKSDILINHQLAYSSIFFCLHCGLKILF